MATLTISLSDDRAEFARNQARHKGFDTVDAYLDAVLADLQARAAKRKRLDSLLLEGLNSGPPVPVTPETWEEIRHEVGERRAAKRRAQ